MGIKRRNASVDNHVHQSLAYLAARDRRSTASQIHGYQLNPVISEQALVDLETTNGFRLPPQYRRFLLEVGNGGAGPYGGLLPIEESLASWKYMLATDALKPILSKTSPLTTDQKADQLLPLDLERHDELMESDGYRDKINEAFAKTWRRLLRGTLRICEYGCGDFFFVPLMGPQSDQVWGDSLENLGGLFSLGVDFDTWYANWLERSLAGLKRKTRSSVEQVRYFEYADAALGRAKNAFLAS